MRSMSCCASVDATERFLLLRPVSCAPSTPLSTAAVVIARTIAPTMTSTRTEPRSPARPMKARATAARRRWVNGGFVVVVARTGGWDCAPVGVLRRNECGIRYRERYRDRKAPALEPWGRNRHLDGGSAPDDPRGQHYPITG